MVPSKTRKNPEPTQSVGKREPRLGTPRASTRWESSLLSAGLPYQKKKREKSCKKQHRKGRRIPSLLRPSRNDFPAKRFLKEEEPSGLQERSQEMGVHGSGPGKTIKGA